MLCFAVMKGLLRLITLLWTVGEGGAVVGRRALLGEQPLKQHRDGAIGREQIREYIGVFTPLLEAQMNGLESEGWKL